MGKGRDVVYSANWKDRDHKSHYKNEPRVKEREGGVDQKKVKVVVNNDSNNCSIEMERKEEKEEPAKEEDDIDETIL